MIQGLNLKNFMQIFVKIVTVFYTKQYTFQPILPNKIDSIFDFKLSNSNPYMQIIAKIIKEARMFFILGSIGCSPYKPSSIFNSQKNKFIMMMQALNFYHFKQFFAKMVRLY